MLHNQIRQNHGIFKGHLEGDGLLEFAFGARQFAYVLIVHNILIGDLLGVLLSTLCMDYGLFNKVFGSLVIWLDDISQLVVVFPLMAIYLSSRAKHI